MDSPIRVYETWWKINEQIIKAQLKSSIGDLSTGWHHREKILRDGDRSGWTPRSVPTRSLSFRPVELTSAPGLYNMVVLSKLVGGFNHLEKYESQREGLSHILWKITKVPNHQPDICSIYFSMIPSWNSSSPRIDPDPELTPALLSRDSWALIVPNGGIIQARVRYI